MVFRRKFRGHEKRCRHFDNDLHEHGCERSERFYSLNTVSSADGVTGLIPAYHVWDWSVNWQIAKQYALSAGVNNFINVKYFNRRITMYPGPGILPADGRTFYFTAKIKI